MVDSLMLSDRDAHLLNEEEEMKVDHKVPPHQQVMLLHTRTRTRTSVTFEPSLCRAS